ncbi:zinc transporter ZIP1 isoform X2 [Eurytemora carolleeae]|uniref:zinc transporter ZIP1 isoform X1 n=1 Tax=Eurytemora carolleeae TaxID=1294199 RepID=UPI000C767AB9|nr:zinc transporter ZIP1 isoform X1 [Eurytemora carolleeae]XP_023322721.1 zinc transporter ZIP1 isoform X2 [Eurytemora carolleeae]|eukprot:XP_023322720.1 zinc transporter ZIP1-like isoform X1 [Eurytemora affinis]
MDTSTILEEMEYTTIDDVEKMGAKALISEKIIVMVSMFAVTFLFGLIPLKLFSAVRENTDVTSRIRWKNVLSFASCFAGGVFIAACLLDLVPDVEEKINEVLEEIKDSYGVDVEYPLAQFIIVMGFFLILTVEQTVLYFQESWMSEAERQPLLSRSRQTSVNQNDFESISRQDSITGLSNVVHHTHDGHTDHSHISHGVFQHSTLRSIMLLLALSFHSVFEGLAIGLQDDSASLISIFVAVIVHKAVMAFSLGLNIAQSVMSVKNFIISNFIFSISSPIGLAVGIGIADLPSSLPQNIANGILQGIAGGTFLYITFFEVLPHELNVPTNRLWKVLFVLLGFALICGLLFITH